MKDSVVADRVINELYNKFPEVQAEYGNVKLLFLYSSCPRLLHFTKKEARVPNDVKGVKIIATEIMESITKHWSGFCRTGTSGVVYISFNRAGRRYKY
jgi:hypothetical protein